jgi:hypothetical protein
MDIQIIQFQFQKNYLFAHPYLLKLMTIHGMLIMVFHNT